MRADLEAAFAVALSEGGPFVAAEYAASVESVFCCPTCAGRGMTQVEPSGQGYLLCNDCFGECIVGPRDLVATARSLKFAFLQGRPVFRSFIQIVVNGESVTYGVGA